MKKLLALASFFLLTQYGFTQHYYNDLVSIRLSNENYKLLKEANVSLVKGLSYEADNTISENFLLEQQFSRDRKKIVTRATSTNNTTSITTSHYENDRLVRTSDSLSGVNNFTEYEYDASGKLVKTKSTSTDPERSGGNTSEVHEWFYQQNGSPELMLKIKNKVDTVRVSFIYDELGNIVEEQWKRKARKLDTYYYYYNDKNQLTDIVRFNAKARKMLPDFIFQYDGSGRISQMIQVLASGNYLTWKYSYDAKGIKLRDECYNKNKQLVGKVVYTYK